MLSSTKLFSTQITSHRAPSPAPAPVATAAPKLDDWGRLDRFLALGSEDGTFYVAERPLTIAEAPAVTRCLVTDGRRAIRRIIAIAEAGRAARPGPAIFALAIAARLGDDATRQAAYAALPRVCRSDADLLRFAEHAQGFGGWGRGMRNAVGAWFNGKPAAALARQLAQDQRGGWSNRDLVRLAQPSAASASHDRLFAWAMTGEVRKGTAEDPALAMIVAMTELKALDRASAVARLIRDRQLPLACVPARWLGSPEVWDALLEAMPLATLIGNLAAMTRAGLLAEGSAASKRIARQLRARRRVRKARLHPIAVLAARVAYQAGRAALGSATWSPVASVVDALDAAFYASFGAVEASGKRTLIALDVSDSMACGAVAGVPALSPRLASAAMALVTAATEHQHHVVAFTAAAGGQGGKWGGGTPGITTLSIAPRQRLDDVVASVGRLPMGGTDCALPMIWARHNKLDVDTFCIYTDDETWAGDVHPAQALRAYRCARGIAAKLVVVGMTSSGFHIADPDDAGMVDVVGFDARTPPVIADFARA